jgi:hypothetical protein
MSGRYTIKIGGYEDAQGMRQALKDAGCDISDPGTDDLLSKVAVSTDMIELRLAVVTVEELGLGERATREEIYDRANDAGLGVCPPETGPQLWLQHRDEIDDLQLFIGMEPLPLFSGDRVGVFTVGRYGPKVFLGTWDAPSDGTFYGGQSWVFVRRA